MGGAPLRHPHATSPRQESCHDHPDLFAFDGPLDPEQIGDLTSRTAFITGGNRGDERP
jgi:hypothetical protein